MQVFPKKPTGLYVQSLSNVCHHSDLKRFKRYAKVAEKHEGVEISTHLELFRSVFDAKRCNFFFKIVLHSLISRF